MNSRPPHSQNFQSQVALPSEKQLVWQKFCAVNLVKMCVQPTAQSKPTGRLLGFLMILWLLSLVSARSASDVTFGWDPSADGSVVGYNIYYGTSSHIYTNKVAVGNVTTATIGGLVDGVTYYFAATTYDTLNLESSFCDEVAYMVPATPTNQPPAINALQATNQADAGESLAFTVTASGTGPLAYQWMFNGSNIVSATNALLAFTNISTSQSGTYLVMVTNTFGSATSAPVSLSVSVMAAIFTQLAEVNGQFTANVTGRFGHQYVVQASTNLTSWIAIATNTSPFNFVDADSSRFSQRYYRAFLPASVSVLPPTTNQPPAITALLATNAASPGQNLNFSVTATGTGPLVYQWMFNGSNLFSGTNAIFSLNNVTTSQAGTYFVIVTNNYGSVTSSPVNLAINFAVAVLTPATPINGHFALSVVGQPGYQYVVQASTNLVNWIAIATNISPFNFVDTDPGRFQERFYRTYFLGLPATNSVSDVTNGLYAYYPLAANGNDLENGNNLMLAGFPSFSAGAVNWNGAVPTLGYSAAQQWPQSGVTVSAWINMADPTANYIVASCYGDTSGQLQQAYMQFFTMNGGLTARIVQNIDVNYIGRVSPARLTAGWHFVSFTWTGGTDSSSLNIYLDGARVDSADANGGTFTGVYSGADVPFTVGAQFSDGWGISGRFYGQEKGVRMYNRALSPNEIGLLYSNGLNDYNY